MFTRKMQWQEEKSRVVRYLQRGVLERNTISVQSENVGIAEKPGVLREWADGCMRAD
jgi:hypothetical protein